MPELKVPSSEWKESYLAGVREFLDEGLPIKINYDEIANHFDEYLQKIEDKKSGKGLPQGYSPETELWLVDGKNYIGTVKIRHTLNDILMQTEGHIGYHIRPSQRGKGYGTLVLQFALPVAKALGINPVLVTCDETNIGSQKIIVANGGVMENCVFHGEGKPRRLRYWITIS